MITGSVAGAEQQSVWGGGFAPECVSGHRVSQLGRPGAVSSNRRHLVKLAGRRSTRGNRGSTSCSLPTSVTDCRCESLSTKWRSGCRRRCGVNGHERAKRHTRCTALSQARRASRTTACWLDNGRTRRRWCLFYDRAGTITAACSPASKLRRSRSTSQSRSFDQGSETAGYARRHTLVV